MLLHTLSHAALLNLMLSILKVLLTLANGLSQYVKDKQLLDAGADKAIANNLNDSIKKLDSAIIARRNAKRVPNDPNNRDGS